jgi:DNA-binding NarL/FixJ family response regulator
MKDAAIPSFRILVADDQTLIRESYSLLLKQDERFKVIGVCNCADQLFQMSFDLFPDIIIIDINLSVMSGFEATRILCEQRPGIRILGISLYAHPVYARKMFEAGAMGFITKNSSPEELTRALIEISNGRKFICEEVKNILAEQKLTGTDIYEKLNLLSKREMDIIRLLRQGFSSKEIASSVNISVKTVEVHRYNILRKLSLPNVAALVNYINNSHLAMAN